MEKDKRRNGKRISEDKTRPWHPVSLVIECDTQEEIDYYWGKLSYVPEAEQCGWLQDKYGLSWQVVPADLSRMLINGTPEQRKSVTEKYMDMKIFNIKEIKDAFDKKRI